jgi:hypothetical protein
VRKYLSSTRCNYRATFLQSTCQKKKEKEKKKKKKKKKRKKRKKERKEKKSSEYRTFVFQFSKRKYQKQDLWEHLVQLLF